MRATLALMAMISLCFHVSEVHAQGLMNRTHDSVINDSPLLDFDRVRLEGKWVVESVELDGDMSGAQIGQFRGDEVSLSSDANVGLPRIS